MNTTSKALLQIAALAVLSTGSGMAQTGDRLKVSVPFHFTVGKKMLPAGEYTITSGLGTPVVHIHDARFHAQVMVLSIPGNKPSDSSNSRLVFRVHGGERYLASIWSETAGVGREFVESSAEREAELAAGPTTYETLVARR